jgi:hypothetical protein
MLLRADDKKPKGKKALGGGLWVQVAEAETEGRVVTEQLASCSFD